LRLRQVTIRLIGLGILALILSRLDLAATAATLARVRWEYLLLALAIVPALFGLKSRRWQRLLKLQEIDYPGSDAFLAFMAGLFLGLLTPGRVGEMGRALYLKQDLDVPLSEGLVNVLMDRLFDLYAILVCGAAGLVWFRLLPSWALALIVTGLVGLLLMPPALLSERLAAWSLSLVRSMPWLRTHADRLAEEAGCFQDGLRSLLTPKLGIPLILTVLAQCLFFGQAWLLALALDLEVGIIYLAVSVSLAGVLTLLPISFSGLGTRDAVLIAMFAPLGLLAEPAVAYSTLYFLTFYVGSGLIGALAWQMKPLANRS
jgi:uncharacterized protein (TIRG00374 family)